MLQIKINSVRIVWICRISRLCFLGPYGNANAKLKILFPSRVASSSGFYKVANKTKANLGAGTFSKRLQDESGKIRTQYIYLRDNLTFKNDFANVSKRKVFLFY